MDKDAQEVLANTRTATLAEAREILNWLLSQAMDDATHQRQNSHHVTLVQHEGEKEARAVLMPIEAWQILLQALVKGENVP